MSYNKFFNNIKDEEIEIIFELGSRDILDAIQLIKYFKNTKCYSFECNPDCLIHCKKNIKVTDDEIKKNIFLVEKAVCRENKTVKFFPFDLNKYDNMGASSLLKIDFSKRNSSDPDFNRPNPQKEITVEGIRLDTFMKNMEIEKIDLLCMDLQGYELEALKSLGTNIKNVKYIITECSINPTYLGGCSFVDLENYLRENGFEYVMSPRFGKKRPNTKFKYFMEFNSLFVKKN